MTKPRRARARKPVEADTAATLPVEPAALAPEVAPFEPVPAVAAEDSVQFRTVRTARRGRAGVLVAAGIVLACGASAALGLGKAMDGRSHAGLKAVSPVATAVPADAAPLADATSEAALLADYAPPDRDQVRRAYDDVGRVYGTEGLSGVVRLGMDCFTNLEARPAYGQLDYCLAYDAFGAALQRHVTGGQPLPAGSWFGGAGPRALKAAQKVVGRDGDPSARVFDVQRLAGEVSHEGPGGGEPAELTVAAAPAEPAASPAPSSDPEGAPAAAPALAAVPAALVRASTTVKPAAPALRPALKPETDRPAKAVRAARSEPATVKATARLAKPKPANAQKAALKAPAKAAPKMSTKASKPAKLTKAVDKPKARKAGPLAKLERAAVQARDAVFKPRPAKPVKASTPKKAKPKPVKAPERAAAPKKPRLVAASTVRRAAPPAPRVQKASTGKRVTQRYRDGMPVVDCRRPVGRSEKEICQAVRVADRRALNYPPYEPDGDGTLDGQYERWRGRGDD